VTPLTKCNVGGRSKGRALSLATLVRCVGWAAVATSLVLIHVYVQFTLSDLRISTRRIQTARERLENEANELRVEVLRLQGKERIERLVKEWGMQAPLPGQVKTMKVPETLMAKYEGGQWRLPRALEDEPVDTAVENPLVRMVAGIPYLGGETLAQAAERQN